jgi:hypothetical protein
VITDLFAIADPNPTKRFKAIEQIGLDQNPEKLPALLTQQGTGDGGEDSSHAEPVHRADSA